LRDESLVVLMRSFQFVLCAVQMGVVALTAAAEPANEYYHGKEVSILVGYAAGGGV
jgi:hypothetical protein